MRWRQTNKIKELIQSYGLGAATDVLLFGSSAGGIGVLVNAVLSFP